VGRISSGRSTTDVDRPSEPAPVAVTCVLNGDLGGAYSINLKEGESACFRTRPPTESKLARGMHPTDVSVQAARMSRYPCWCAEAVSGGGIVTSDGSGVWATVWRWWPLVRRRTSRQEAPGPRNG